MSLKTNFNFQTCCRNCPTLMESGRIATWKEQRCAVRTRVQHIFFPFVPFPADWGGDRHDFIRGVCVFMAVCFVIIREADRRQIKTRKLGIITLLTWALRYTINVTACTLHPFCCGFMLLPYVCVQFLNVCFFVCMYFCFFLQLLIGSSSGPKTL